MLTWAGFLGRLLEFVLAKIGDQPCELDPDDRKLAAVAFLRLHDALAKVEALVRWCLRESMPFRTGEKQRLYRTAYASMAFSASSAYTELTKAVQLLHPVLAKYDPRLGWLLMGKGRPRGRLITSSFLSPMRFDLVPAETAVFAIGYTVPSEDLLRDDLCQRYETALKKACEASPDKVPWAMLYWERDFLLEIVEGALVNGVIEAHRLDQVQELALSLETQVAILTAACETLREFIRQRFSLEDLFHVNLYHAITF